MPPQATEIDCYCCPCRVIDEILGEAHCLVDGKCDEALGIERDDGAKEEEG
jgi:hypothetical protein